MSTQARAVYTLYKAKKISLNGVKKAVQNKIITEDEFFKITGRAYV